jgi:alpha-beta hydrolase superfamily lysophospholipase
VGVREPDAALAMLFEIAARNPDAPIVIAGHSLGSGIGLRAARMAAAAAGVPVAGVLALSPYSDLRSPLPARLALRGLPARPFVPVALAMLRAAGCMDRPLERDVAGLDLPVLIVSCEGDRIAPARDAEALAAALPRATLLELPGDRHDEPCAGDWPRAIDSMQAFLRGLSRPSPDAAAEGA